MAGKKQFFGGGIPASLPLLSSEAFQSETEANKGNKGRVAFDKHERQRVRESIYWLDKLESKRLVCDSGHVNDRISISPKVCHGQACIRGTRIPVHQIIRMFAHGDSVEALIGAYPSISRDDIAACLDYAASLAEEQVTPLDDVVLAP